MKYSFKEAIVAVARALLVVLVFLFVPSLVSSVVTAIVTVLNSGMPKEELNSFITNLTSPIMAVSYVATVFVFTIFYKIRKTSLLTMSGAEPTRLSFLIDGGLLGFGMYGAFQGVILLLTKIIPESWFNLQNNQSSSLLGGSIAFAIIYTVLIAPICEEIIFRGLVLSIFDGKVPKWLGVLISALAFAFIHLPSPIAFIYTLTLGIMLGTVRYRTKSLVPCVLAHIIFNATNYLLFLPHNIGLYVALALSLPFIIYSVIDIVRKTRG
jgi:membrane protease YdiL (CAAX protease family)